ncbi:MAG: hypothetical protein ACREUY_10710 [Burkholderiales bacterium]
MKRKYMLFAFIGVGLWLIIRAQQQAALARALKVSTPEERRTMVPSTYNF